MTRTNEAVILAIVLIGIAVLAIFDVIPAQVAQYAPLAVVPWIVRSRRGACAMREC